MRASLSRLVKSIQSHVENPPTLMVWHMNEGKLQIREVPNVNTAVLIAIAKARYHDEFLEALNEFAGCVKADESLGGASRLIGWHGTPEGLLNRIAKSAAFAERGKIVIGPKEAWSILKQLQVLLRKKSGVFEATARLVGLRITRKEVRLSNEIKLVSLSQAEANRLQVPVYMLPILISPNLVYHRTQLNVRFRVSFESSREHAGFDCENRAWSKAQDMFTNVLEALVLTCGGRIELKQLSMMGPFTGNEAFVYAGYEVPQTHSSVLRKWQADRVRDMYRLVVDKGADPVLSRSLRRFILSHKREDARDRIVDLVVGFESLLLQSRHELRHRFSLHGGHVLAKASPDRSARQWCELLTVAYDIRSTLVHGGTEKVKEHLKKVGMGLPEFCDLLENAFRDAIRWLAATRVSDRPYNKSGGWKDLVFPD